MMTGVVWLYFHNLQFVLEWFTNGQCRDRISVWRVFFDDKIMVM